jgi:hypothetical protein
MCCGGINWPIIDIDGLKWFLSAPSSAKAIKSIGPASQNKFFFLSRRAKRLSPFAHTEKRASAQKREVLTPAVNTVCVACVWKMMRLFMSSFQHLVGGVRQNFLRHSDWHLLQSLPPFSTAAREWWPEAQHAGVKIYCTFSLLSEITPSATFHFRPNDFPLTELGYCDLWTQKMSECKK